MKEIVITEGKKCPFLRETENYYIFYKCAYNGKDLGFESKPKCAEFCELKEGIIIKFDIK